MPEVRAEPLGPQLILGGVRDRGVSHETRAGGGRLVVDLLHLGPVSRLRPELERRLEVIHVQAHGLKKLGQGQPEYLHALFDAGAGKRDTGVRALWDFVAAHPQVDVTLRACRYPHRLRRWQQLPSDSFLSVREHGAYVGAAE
jgi:hypothetical protein